MKKYNVMNTMDVGNNTAVIIDGTGELFSKGAQILSDSGSRYSVVSVGMLNGESFGRRAKNATIIVRGKFSSQAIYI